MDAVFSLNELILSTHQVATKDEKRFKQPLSTGPTNHQLNSDSVLPSSSFSFSPAYRNTLCAGSTRFLSTFSASQVRHSLEQDNRNNPESYTLSCNEAQLGQQSKFTVQPNPIGRESPNCFGKFELVANSAHIEQQESASDSHYMQTRRQVTRIQDQENNPLAIVNKRRFSFLSISPVAREPIVTMSQTVQSIHSLSLQLNRAASQMDMQSVGQSPLGLSGGDGQQQSNYIVNSSGKLSKLMSKKASRAKELLLQNLGKADKTTDELFQMYEENFYKQQNQAVKLQKEFKKYLTTLKGAQEAGQSLSVCIQQSTSDYQSARHDLVCENLSQMEHLNEDLMEKLRGQVMASMSEYMSQFNELREKILKRRRKLIDYDSSRRVYELMLANVNKRRQQMNSDGARSFRSTFALTRSSHGDSMQSTANQLVDEARLLKLREQYNYCKIMYETINSELHDELPMIYEKKMKHLLMTLQNYFSLEAQYHSNIGKLFSTSSDVIDEMPMSIHSHSSVARHQVRSMDVDDYSKVVASGSSGMGSSRADSSMESSSSPEASGKESPVGDEGQVSMVLGDDERHVALNEAVTLDDGETRNDIEEKIDDDIEPAKEVAPVSEEDGEVQLEQPESSSTGAVISEGEYNGHVEAKEEIAIEIKAQEENIYQVLNGEEVQNGKVEAECLYKVRSCYKYLAEDVDELCFEADEIIQVVEFKKSDEPEEGWLIGVREVNGQKGLFPANFTLPI